VQSIDPNLYYKVTDGKREWVRSNSKVVFSGLGADEVWAGYARYRTAAKNNQQDQTSMIKAMYKEMSLDLDRIWHRNFGRDDRMISANGKEARFPYLDIETQEWMRDNLPDIELSSLDDEETKTAVSETSTLFDLSEARGEGDKRLLRRVAKECFGLRWGSQFEKRAIQFGSKIAK
jgi:asparagine synthetase B (glutamine-hydrolysing)